MSTTSHASGQSSPAGSATAPTSTTKVTGWVGWVWFGAVMLLLVGVLNVIAGVLAATAPDSAYFTPLTGQLWVLDTTGWGWVHLILGVLLVLVSVFLFSGRAWARVLAVVLVVLNLVTQLLWLPATPWWSIVAIALDILVAWAIIVHGDEARRV